MLLILLLFFLFKKNSEIESFKILNQYYNKGSRVLNNKSNNIIKETKYRYNKFLKKYGIF